MKDLHKIPFLISLMLVMSTLYYSQKMELINQKLFHIVSVDSLTMMTANEKMIEKTFKNNSEDIDTSIDYRFLFLHETGWKENFPSPEYRFKIDAFYAMKDSSVYSGAEIKEIFNLNHIASTDPKDTVPRVQFSLANHFMVPNKSSTKYLRINKGHYYPYGNQTSWMIDRLYYFERIER